jgi:hypothetical protein
MPVRYLYSTIRIVPNPAAGEFVNFATIVGSDATGEWALRPLDNDARARRFASTDVMTAAYSFMADLNDRFDLQQLLIEEDDSVVDLPSPPEPLTESWLHALHSDYRHVIQASEPAPVLAETVEDALDLVVSRMLVEPARRRRGYLTRQQLFSSLTKAYFMAGVELDGDLVRRPVLTANGTHAFHHPVDFVVANGQAVQLSQTWSFQLASQDLLSRDIKAWGWTMRELRDAGGVAQTRKRQIQVPSDVPIEVVIAQPRDATQSAAYEEAIGVFEELSIRVHEHGEEDAIAGTARALLEKAAH